MMQFQAVDNPSLSAIGGAGVQSAQYVTERGSQAVVTGNVGPNAYGVFQAAQIPVYLYGEGTVSHAVEAYKAGQLRSATGATVSQHSGLGRGPGRRRRGQ
jgi:predicted Fe-Mo cluster-binding NifX family protein